MLSMSHPAETRDIQNQNLLHLPVSEKGRQQGSKGKAKQQYISYSISSYWDLLGQLGDHLKPWRPQILPWFFMVFLDFEDSVTFDHAAMPRLHGEGAATKQSLEKLARS